jgi:hypothetical protein
MTSWLTQLFLSGWISVIALVVLWSVLLVIGLRSASPGDMLRQLVPNAVSGSCLLIAYGIAMRQAPLLWHALLLAIALIAFLIDLRLRLAAHASGLRRRTE